MRRAPHPVVLLLVLFSLAGLPAAAQENGSISGHVRDAAGTGLGGVTVTLRETGARVVTDNEGRYAFAAVAPGDYNLDFSFGADNASAPITVTAGAEAALDQSVDWTLSVAETITVYSASRQAERITEAAEGGDGLRVLGGQDGGCLDAGGHQRGGLQVDHLEVLLDRHVQSALEADVQVLALAQGQAGLVVDSHQLEDLAGIGGIRIVLLARQPVERQSRQGEQGVPGVDGLGDAPADP